MDGLLKGLCNLKADEEKSRENWRPTESGSMCRCCCCCSCCCCFEALFEAERTQLRVLHPFVQSGCLLSRVVRLDGDQGLGDLGLLGYRGLGDRGLLVPALTEAVLFFSSSD